MPEEITTWINSSVGWVVAVFLSLLAYMGKRQVDRLDEIEKDYIGEKRFEAVVTDIKEDMTGIRSDMQSHADNTTKMLTTLINKQDRRREKD